MVDLRHNTAIVAEAQRVLQHQIQQLAAIRLERGFASAVRMLAGCAGKVVTTGVGKSGLVADRLAATLTVTGTPALFLHPTEALHGDVGRVHGRSDVLFFVSRSGESEELLGLLNWCRRWQTPTIALTGNADSYLGRVVDCVISHPKEEACLLGLTPTSSLTCASAIGDALALVLQQVREFTPAQFQALHNGGHLGRQLSDIAIPEPDYST